MADNGKNEVKDVMHCPICNAGLIPYQSYDDSDGVKKRSWTCVKKGLDHFVEEREDRREEGGR